MVLDHEGEKETVEHRSAGGVQLLQLRFAEHARHRHVVDHPSHRHLHAGGSDFGDRSKPVAKPLLHDRDFVLLSIDDPLGQCPDCRIRIM